MRTKIENKTLTLYLEGRIDSVNAPQIEQDLFAEIEKAQGRAILLDADQLAYISSAGLRVLMKLKKKLKADLPILDVSPVVIPNEQAIKTLFQVM